MASTANSPAKPTVITNMVVVQPATGWPVAKMTSVYTSSANASASINRVMPTLALNPASVYSARLSMARLKRWGAPAPTLPSNSRSVIFKPQAA